MRFKFLTWIFDGARGEADKSAVIDINLSLEARQEAGCSVGARADDVGQGGPLWSPGGDVIALPHMSAQGTGRGRP